MKEPCFEGVLRNGWSLSRSSNSRLHISPLSLVAGKLRNLKEHIKSWRKVTIEKARREQVELTSKINGINLLAETGQISEDLLRDRQNAYQKIMENEARRIEDLKQKSRTKWGIEGDENSAFFHGLMNKHQRLQRINGIKDNGFWICNPAAIKEVVFNHFAC